MTDPIDAVAALSDPLRRGMYAYIRQVRRPVSRDEAAASVGISRKLAAFHLDKLVAAGVLRAHYAPAGEARKVGRTPKVYEPSGVDIRVSIPQRHPDLLAEILVAAAAAGGEIQQAATEAARTRGEAEGEAERTRTRPGRLGTERALTLAAHILTQHGYEPDRTTPTTIRLRNCPFHPLAAKAPTLVCAINRSFCHGILTGLAATTITATLAPTPGECCVELHEKTQASRSEQER